MHRVNIIADDALATCITIPSTTTIRICKDVRDFIAGYQDINPGHAIRQHIYLNGLLNKFCQQVFTVTDWCCAGPGLVLLTCD